MLSILVIATRNKNKLREFKEILSDLQIEICSLDDFGPIPEAIEDGQTFDENAYKKAIHTAKILGLPAIADDSGLVVEALNGEPGVFSARYAGDNATDQDNLKKVLKKLSGVKNRKAYFQCVLSIAVPSGPALTYEGRCDGVIIDDQRGNNGFGYDPVFYFEEFGKTFAELTMEEKNRVSHRGKALSEVKSEILMIKKWLEQRLQEEKPEKPDHSQFENNDWTDDM
ncbi:XTP/dITP diphosphatase [Desulforhopalus singaporensis]|uniref:dITP/XTP pyrophosphatase n=1 Tax=Desulforhopalus singaporensis TaxID=91360 RepID=A0A1H0VXR7_9BACT|nr:XTP/dITP diphosphatase [Desulforhopalus singaporensis]SDP83028.1 XTP/dITP diphosphohydrolase [Desulforhopalus singaporensis]